MIIQYISHFLNGFLMVAIPIGLGIYLSRRFGLGWRLWWIGAATFVLSQIGHIPFNVLLGELLDKGFHGGIIPLPQGDVEVAVQAIAFGLSAAFWEELIRYAVYRWWAKDARSSDRGLMMGAGHGGIEAIILGVVVLANYVFMIIAQTGDVSSMVPAEYLGLLQQQVTAYWSMPWYMSLLGALERIFAITFYLSASLIVLQAVVRRKFNWVWLAVLWHALLDGVAVFVNEQWGPLVTELVLAWLALISVAIIIWLYQPASRQAEVEETPATLQDEGDESLPKLEPVEETPDNLENTRFDA